MVGFQTEQPELHEKYSILYGILYELMNNVAKHAQATHALIQIIEHEDSVVVMVEDNGIGLMKEPDMTASTHGLTAIQSKIHYLNGAVVLDRAIPHGLIVTIEIPKENNDKNYPG
jgi:signal transduction histidine kinase